jgi:outer membrane protein assembly factor BamB
VWEGIAIGLDSTIYFTTGFAGTVGARKAFIYALRPDVTVRWKHGFDTASWGDGFSAPLISADGAVWLTGPGQFLYAFSPDGAMLAKVPIAHGSDLNVGPDGTFYMSRYVANSGFALYALTREGVVKWQAVTEGGIRYYGGGMSPLGDVIYAYCVSPQNATIVEAVAAFGVDGTLRWKFPLPGEVRLGTPLLVDSQGRVYFGAQDGVQSRLYSLSPEGQLNWSVGQYVSGSDELTLDAEGNVYFGTWASRQELASVDCRGQLRWAYPLSADEGPYAGPVCDREGVVYSFLSRVVAVSSQGALLWEVPLEGRFTRIAAPAISADGTLYLGTFGKPSRLYAIE